MEKTDNELLRGARGKAYYTILKRILAKCGEQMTADAHQMKADNGKFTLFNIGQLAIKYDLNFKATCEWLEESGALPTGTYIRLMRAGVKATEVLAAAREKKTSV